MIPQGERDLTAYLNELLRTNKPEQQNNTFWFPTPENPRKPEDHTPIQTRILRELNELKDKENSIHKRAQNPKTNFSNDLIGLTHFLKKRKNKQLKIFWLIIMTSSPDIEWILG